MPAVEYDFAASKPLVAVLSSDWQPVKRRKEEDHILKVFNLSTGALMTEFHVLWDSGGKRLAVSPDGTSIYLGCYYVHGLAAYSIESGKELWRRQDLKSVQQVQISPDGLILFCGREQGAAHVLVPASGDTNFKPRGLKEVWFSNNSGFALTDSRSKCLEIHRPLGEKHGSVSRASFGVRGAAFSSDAMVIWEAENIPLRCFDLTSLKERWRFPRDPGHWAAGCGYDTERNCFLTFAAQDRNQRGQLTQLNPNTGESLPIAKEGGGEFNPAGTLMVNREGTVWCTRTGRQIHNQIFGTNLPSKDQLFKELVLKFSKWEELREYLEKEGFSKKEIEKAQRIREWRGLLG